MARPRLIILVRHAQSEGNKNRGIHQTVPDHRVKLTPDGHKQALEAGKRLRSMLRLDDKIQFFTSPYRRTRETTEGILTSLTSDDPAPSPFRRHNIKVYEEPRLREQDFGNFQPCSTEMERMWQERAEYGHFFYRIPNGESAADAYDRISGFNESLWRQFGEDDCASVYVLVTHGLMTRVFLMKWYHWSVEYFEDLRNVEHCEFIVMKKNEAGKYILQNKLRTWSELRDSAEDKPDSPSAIPAIPPHKWGGCINGCDHTPRNPKAQRRRSLLRRSTSDAQTQTDPDTQAQAQYQMLAQPAAEKSDVAALEDEASVSMQFPRHPDSTKSYFPPQPPSTHQVHVVSQPPASSQPSNTNQTTSTLDHRPASNTDTAQSSSSQPTTTKSPSSPPFPEHRFGVSAPPRVALLAAGRDFGGSRSGVSSPEPFASDAELSSDDSGQDTQYRNNNKSHFPEKAPSTNAQQVESSRTNTGSASSHATGQHQPNEQGPGTPNPIIGATSLARSSSSSSPVEIEDLRRRMQLSGMDPGAQADALGDHIVDQSASSSHHLQQQHSQDNPSRHNRHDHGHDADNTRAGPAEPRPNVNAELKALEELEKEDKSLRGSVY